MPCAFWLNATLPPPWSWPQAHWLCISLGYFPGTLPYQSRKSSRRMQGASVEMPPHTPSAIKTFANSTSQKLFIIQAIVIHPLILSSIPRNGIAKKSNIAPKKIQFVFHSWFFLTIPNRRIQCVYYMYNQDPCHNCIQDSVLLVIFVG